MWLFVKIFSVSVESSDRLGGRHLRADHSSDLADHIVTYHIIVRPQAASPMGQRRPPIRTGRPEQLHKKNKGVSQWESFEISKKLLSNV